MKKIIYILILSLFIFSAKAQQPNTMFFMDNMPQSMQLNPANSPHCKFFLGLPVISSTGLRFQSDIGIQDILLSDNNGGYGLPINSPDMYNQFVNNLGEVSNVRLDMSTNILSFGFKLKSGYFAFNSNIRAYGDIGIASDFSRINNLVNGTHLDFATTHIQLNTYKEFGFAYSHNVNDRLQIGVKYKLLSGIANINSDISNATLDINDYKWDVAIHGDVNISAPVHLKLDDEDRIVDVIENSDILDDPVEMAKYYGLGLKNTGHAFDFGAKYKVSDRINVQASILDLGWINWSDNTSSITFNGSTSFEGIEVNLSDLDSIDNIITDLTDSIANSFIYSVDSAQTYKNSLPTRVYIGGQYALNNRFSVGVLYNGRFNKDYQRHKMVYSLNYNGMRGWSMGVNYNQLIKGADNLGALVSFKLTPFQLYLCAEGIPTFWQKYQVEGQTIPFAKETNTIYLQMGINVRFGCKRIKNQQFRNSGFANKFPFI